MHTSNFIAYAEGVLDYGIVGVLITMSIVTLWLFIERLMFYRSIRLEDYQDKAYFLQSWRYWNC